MIAMAYPLVTKQGSSRTTVVDTTHGPRRVHSPRG